MKIACLGLGGISLCVALSACSGGSGSPVGPIAASTPTPTPTPTPSPMPMSSPTPSPTPSSAAPARIAVGAYVSPPPTVGGPRNIDALETSIGRPLDYDLHYDFLIDPFPQPGELDDLAHGRTVIASIHCENSTAVVLGTLDNEIDALADAMKSFGAPIEMRYCYEMNLPKNALTPTAFIAEWKHFHDRFVADGATNVRFLWCPSNEQVNPSSGIPFYPGDAYVDDVGYDAYDDDSVGFQELMDSIYPYYEAIGKSIIVSETGAPRKTDQTTYLTAESVDLIRKRYPAIKAIVYFDRDGPLGNWALSRAGLESFAAFADAAR